MLSYQTLDAIADTYIPALIILIVISMAAHFRHAQILLIALCKLTLLALLPYGLMFADQALHLWQQYGWDYSTHTAVAATCCWYLFELRKAPAIAGHIFHSYFIWPLWPLSFSAYLILMNYQNYHSWQDMISTTMALIPFLVIHKIATR